MQDGPQLLLAELWARAEEKGVQAEKRGRVSGEGGTGGQVRAKLQLGWVLVVWEHSTQPFLLCFTPQTETLWKAATASCYVSTAAASCYVNTAARRSRRSVQHCLNLWH